MYDKYHNGEKQSSVSSHRRAILPILKGRTVKSTHWRGEPGITTGPKLTLSPNTLNRVQEGLIDESCI